MIISEEKNTFSSYRELLYYGPSGDLLLNVCTLLHGLEMDIRSKVGDVKIDRDLALEQSHLVVKINITYLT